MVNVKEPSGQLDGGASSPRDSSTKSGNSRNMKPHQPKDSSQEGVGDSIDALAPHRHNAQASPSLLQSLHYALKVAQRRKKPAILANIQPRWHSQSYMLFLALRQASGHCLPRTDLIKNALELDQRISKEHNLPRVFRGKTPMNSASAILTNNSDRYFIPFKPAESRSKHFRLASTPSHAADAVKSYRGWERKLIENDWPLCFGRSCKPSSESVAALDVTGGQETQEDISVVTTEFDQFLAGRKRKRHRRDDDKENHSVVMPKVLKSDLTAIPDPRMLANLPKRWQDVLRVSDTGAGVIALRSIPASTPLGFYFGVPMTEDEFDSLKSGVGQASDLCLMYDNTVLDATDVDGQRYKNPSSAMYCPFHFLNDTLDETKVNVDLLQGEEKNQILCWTHRDIEAGEELFRYAK